MHGLNWDDIRYFLAVIEAGSVTAAAVQLGVNHSTVSRRVTGFESQLGTKLFDRGPLGWAITPAGEGLLYSARGIAESVYAMRREVEGADRALSGVLRITAPHLCFQQLLGPPLKAFSDEYPDIHLQLIASDEPLNLAYGDSDVAFRTTDDPPPNLVGKRLATVAYAIYGTEELRQRLEDEQLSVPAVTWIGDGQSIPPWVRKGSPKIQVKYRVNTLNTMLDVARQGIAVAQLPCLAGDQEPLVRRIPADYVEPGWGLWILYPVDLRTTARVRIFRDFMMEALETCVPLIEGEQPMSVSND